MPRSNYIEHYTGGKCILPELDALGFDENFAATRRLEAHAHPRAYEICYISGGEVNWWAKRKVFRVGKGDLYITGPGEEHGGVDSMMHACELYFLQIAFPARTPLFPNSFFAAFPFTSPCRTTVYPNAGISTVTANRRRPQIVCGSTP